MSKNLEREPGDLLTYKDQRTFGIVAGKHEVEVTPKYGGAPYKAGDIIRLEIPAQAWMNPEEFYIHWRARILPGKNDWEDGANGLAPDSRKMPYITHKKLNHFTNGVLGNMRPLTFPHSVQFKPGIQSCIERIKLLSGTTQIEDIQDYHVLYRMYLESMTSHDWRNGDGFMEEGYWDPKDPKQQYANANFFTERHGGKNNNGKYFTFKPLLGLLRCGKAIPLKYMGQLTIEIYLAPNAEALWSSSYNVADNTKTILPYSGNSGFPSIKEVTHEANNGMGQIDTSIVKPSFPNAYYEIDEIKMHIPFIHPEEDYDNAMMQRIESEGLDIHFSTYSMTSRQLTAPGSTQISFQERATSIKGGLAVMRNSPSIRNIQSDMVFHSNMIEWYQWKIGNEYLPAQQILCANSDESNGPGMALASLKKSIGTFQSDYSHSNIHEEDFLLDQPAGEIEAQNYFELKRQASQPSKFIMGLDLEKSPHQVSGFDSAAASVDIELWFRTRPYKDVTPQVDGAKKQDGSTQALFQPTKIPVVGINLSADQGESLLHDSAKYIWTDNSMHDLNLPTRFMVPVDVTTTFTSIAYKLPAINGITRQAVPGVYSRINFYAHIDSVVRLKRVGQIEILR